MTKIFALVQEREDPVFVTTLTDAEIDELGDFGIEKLVEEWCEKKKLTFMDIAL